MEKNIRCNENYDTVNHEIFAAVLFSLFLGQDLQHEY